LFGYCKEVDVKYCKVDPDEKLVGFEDATKFIDEELGKGKNVMVHCSNGEGKSAAVIIYYMMKKHKKSIASTVRSLRRYRDIKPRITSVEYLMACEKKLIGQSTVALGGKGNREIVCTDEGSSWGSGGAGGNGSSTSKKKSSGSPFWACLFFVALSVSLVAFVYLVTGRG